MIFPWVVADLFVSLRWRLTANDKRIEWKGGVIMNAPELSICIYTYNSAHFLPDAIGSVMRQGLEDFEIVIVDNASQDDTEALVRGLNNQYIRYFKNPENFGPHYSATRCIAEARGKYMRHLCADDVLVDGVLLKQMGFSEDAPTLPWLPAICALPTVSCAKETYFVSFRESAPRSGC
jgi:glycosyltransferase involved in cell wall biosynthesis